MYFFRVLSKSIIKWRIRTFLFKMVDLENTTYLLQMAETVGLVLFLIPGLSWMRLAMSLKFIIYQLYVLLATYAGLYLLTFPNLKILTKPNVWFFTFYSDCSVSEIRTKLWETLEKPPAISVPRKWVNARNVFFI